MTTNLFYFSVAFDLIILSRVVSDSCFYDSVSIGPGMRAFVLINETFVRISGNVSHLKLDKVYYECEDSTSLLVGDQTRRCDRGYLSGQNPRCAISYGNASQVSSISVRHSSAKLSASQFYLRQAQSSFAAFRSSVSPPDQCIPLLNFAEHNFSLRLSKAVETHFVRIKFYGLNLKNLWITNKIAFRLFLESTDCHFYGADHSETVLSNHYLTLNFECNQTREALTTDEIKLAIAQKTQSVKWIFLCDLSLYYFDESCGEPDLPINMNVRPMTFSWYYLSYEYECKDSDRYVIRGNSQIQCGPYGKWSHEFATCVSKDVVSCLSDHLSWTSTPVTLISSQILCTILIVLIIICLYKLYAFGFKRFASKSENESQSNTDNKKNNDVKSLEYLYDDTSTHCNGVDMKVDDESADEEEIYEKID